MSYQDHAAYRAALGDLRASFRKEVGQDVRPDVPPPQPPMPELSPEQMERIASMIVEEARMHPRSSAAMIWRAVQLAAANTDQQAEFGMLELLGRMVHDFGCDVSANSHFDQNRLCSRWLVGRLLKMSAHG